MASLNPGVPVELRRITERCLAKEAQDRYASTRDLARDLRDARDHWAEATAGSQQRATDGGSAPVVPTDRPEPGAARRWPLLLSGAALLVLALAGGWLVLKSRSRDQPATRDVQASIAVLPFETIGGRAEDEYFSDGMTESIITDLAKAKGLLVIARNSVFPYKGKNVDIPRVGHELNVGYLLEGSVQRSTGRVRVNAKLIEVATGFQRWAERYDREMKHVFDVQDDIAKNIVAALELTLRPEAARPLLPLTTNLEAYDLYLQGLSVARRAASQQDLGEAITLFERAVAADPQFALAHASLGESYRGMSFDYDPQREWEDKAYAEVLKALTLDPNRAEPYYARGLLAWTLSHGFPHEAAAADLRRALEINPNLADAHWWLGLLYNHVGLLDRALEEVKTARRLDPSGYSRDGIVPLTYLYQHEYQRALGVYEKDPKTYFSALAHAPALIYLGREAEARRLVDQRLQGEPRNSTVAALHALLLAREGEGRKAEEAIARTILLGEGFGHVHHDQYFIASAYALLGNKREAVAWLEKAAENGLPCYPYFEKDPHLASLRTEPDFQAFMKKLKVRWEHYKATL